MKQPGGKDGAWQTPGQRTWTATLSTLVAQNRSFFAIFLLTAPAWLPLLIHPGLVNTRAGGDSPFLIQRVHQMAAALAGGHFPVRWMPDGAYGFGYPFWNYYAPLVFYLAAILHLAGLSIVSAIKLTQLTGFLVAAWGMFALTRDMTRSRLAALLTAVVYTYAPFHLVNVYVRGDSLGEFWAFAWYPLIFWGIRRLSRRPGSGAVALVALAYAGLVLTHNISALIFTPFAAAYALFQALFRTPPHHRGPASRWIALVMVGTALGLGVVLSAWYWAPALREQSAVQLEGNLTGYFHYGGHFRDLSPTANPKTRLIQSNWLFDFDVDGPETPFAMGLVQALLGGAGLLGVLLALIRNRQRAGVAEGVFVAGMALVATWLMTPSSRPVWDRVPLLPFVQFPWRWLSVQAFALSILMGVAVAWAGSLTWLARSSPWLTQRHVRAFLFGVPAVLLMLSSLLTLQVTYLPLRAEDIVPQRLMLYEMFTGNIGSTVRAEYLPAAVNPRPWTAPWLMRAQAAPPIGAQAAQLLDRRPARQRWSVTVDEPREVVFPTYWFPGWRATIDGQPVETAARPGHGGIRVMVPAGTHAVVLWLDRTPTRRLAELASGLGALLIIGLLWRPLVQIDGRTWARAGLSAVVWGVVLISLLLWQQRGAIDGPLTMDFSRMPYLHPNPQGVPFADGSRLWSYTLSSTTIPAGQTLAVEMTWATPQTGAQVQVALVSPAAVLFHVPAVIAEATAPLRENVTLRLQVPPKTNEGLYPIRVRVTNVGQSVGFRSPDGAEITDLYLQPVRIRPIIAPPEQPIGQFADLASLLAIETRQQDPQQLQVDLTWQANRAVAVNYVTSLRLKDPTGRVIAQSDTQPCYGFCPTSLWGAGVPIYDRRWLDLPLGTPPGNTYQLEVVLYEAASQTPVGTLHFDSIPLTEISVHPTVTPRFAFPMGLAVVQARVDRNRVEPGETIPVQVVWSVQKPLAQDPGPQILLLNETGEQIVHAEPAPLIADIPASRWPVGAYVDRLYRVTVPRDLLPGRYRLAVGVEETAGRYFLDPVIEVLPSTRVFTPPDLPHSLEVDFGDQIRLVGYDLKRDTQTLRLQVAWQALVDIDQRYKIFVHLFDPATEQIVAQQDTEPKQRERPTSSWIAGEVVTDEFVLDLSEVPAGLYQVAVGLYKPATGERLPAITPAGERLPADRVILEPVIRMAP